MTNVVISRDAADWLVAHRLEMERGEAAWLERLAEFDLSGEWAADGQLCCASWMVWHLKMARATAYEKLQVAHQLRSRSIIAEAFSAGRLSYSAVRAITRIEHPDRDVDEALVLLAEAGTVSDVEKAVRFYQLHADQHRPPTDVRVRQSLRCRNNLDGTATVEITLAEVDAEELLTLVQAFAERPTSDVAEPVDESARADTLVEAPLEEAPLSARRAQALVEMARVAVRYSDRPQAPGADRYMVHLVVRGDHTETIDGVPISEATARRIRCDCSMVHHLVGPAGEPLALGRRTREWSTAQRRAITVRDSRRCRFPGCENHFVDVHHHQWWSGGGLTDVANGYLLCARHHTMIHEQGYKADGDPNGTLTFHRPDGWLIGSTGTRSALSRVVHT